MKKYWAMAGAYFGLYGFLLTAFPVVAISHGRSAFEASMLVAVVAAVGFFGDATVSSLAQRTDNGVAALIGSALIALGTLFVVMFPAMPLLISGAAVTGLGLSYVVTPVLGGLSTRAGKNQVSAQAVNALVQRGGALAIGLFLGYALSSMVGVLVPVALALLVLTLGGFAMHREDRVRIGQARGARVAWRAAVTSATVQQGVVVNLATPLWIIAGSSLFPLLVISAGEPGLLVPAIIARESLAICTALLMWRVRSRRALHHAWLASTVIGAAGFVTSGLVDHTFPVVALFSLHGACIAIGIIYANVLFFDGTTNRNRIAAFSLGSMAARTTALVYPLLFASALSVSPFAAMVVTSSIALAIGTTSTVLAAVRRLPGGTAFVASEHALKEPSMNSRNDHIVVIGSINHDRTQYVTSFPSPGETVLSDRGVQGLGGKGANQAVAAARSGATVSLVGAVGRDAEGDATVRALAAHGVNVDAIARVDKPTGQAYIAVNDDGENTIIVVSGANVLPFDTEPAVELMGQASVVLTQGEIASRDIERAARLAAETGARFVLNLAPFTPIEPPLIRNANPLIVNSTEAAALMGIRESEMQSPEAVLIRARHLVGEVCESLVVTLGARGAVVIDRTEAWHVDALAVEDVVDTTGAGDAFVGATCAALCRGESLRAAASAGSVAGGLAVSRFGASASFPDQSEIARTQMVAARRLSDGHRDSVIDSSKEGQ
ncbi:PfkB family carbohydrate kinase [Microbacterium esteraromaticum]|uniref:PfkB family carbohydrate kinase n=1 Tax=Microbacterium esteraromaticum TaxID=57043 RepID=UPI001C94F3BA|nr:PfkB family carbohydrate kinase [Microbacterium esteraromaticum]MBY6062216.1 hypothetical protein [Microbacterium esteraromaticum]